ncbi:hypothetical protein F9C07_9004 [Aspergillus flavus]|uniref:Uncharacterized protein n=1 Tax=Aspergillus flavus (strain ATCC 200026 / FGSC A1120 / IAM 13836 / NRRL 3357 / JCM 12722 / SRRC 167) TaxID=332952 RepID=A0A7U2QTZ7_ASPFN|nr:hypothetical protein F9C07_9004 [Aspergillus flavus]
MRYVLLLRSTMTYRAYRADTTCYLSLNVRRVKSVDAPGPTLTSRAPLIQSQPR